MLYHLFEMGRAGFGPARFAAETTRMFLNNPLNPITHTPFARQAVAAAEVFERTTRRYPKPEFGLKTTKVDGIPVRVTEEVVWETPFCKLVHFKRDIDRARSSQDPRLLLVAPMSGHFATLLRGTVETFLPDHEVYITDWQDAREIPMSAGHFDLDDYVDTVAGMFRFFGGDVHVFAVCQPSVPVLAATAIMEADGDPHVPGGLVDRPLLVEEGLVEAARRERAAIEGEGVSRHAARRGDELVRPLRIGECNECPWLEHCAQVAGPDDASFALLTGHLNDREWRHLYATAGDGHTLSVAQLAAVEVDGCAADFRAQSIGTRDPRARLGNAVRRASMTLSGTDFEPVGGKWPVIPSADVEVDFDIEWDLDNRIYQWGLRIRDGHDDATARYQPVMSFAPLDDAAEAALADEMADRLTRLRADADRDGKSLKVFHWSPVELTQSARFPRVAAALSGVSVDLMAWFNREFFARGSSSIKAVAPLLGFDWGTEDAGGLTSQLRIEEARGTGPAAEAARAWCLRYNEDDVAAQAAIRDGLRRLGDAPRRT